MKKKTTAKKTAKKTTAFDDALTPPASKATIPVATVEVRLPPEQAQILAEEIGNQIMEQIESGEPWPNYSPFPEDEDTGPGFSPTNIAPVTEKVDAVVESWDEPQKEEVVSLGSGEPVDASDPLSGTECHSIPSDASQTVRDLIDGLNYVWKMALTIRGPRGPKQHDESILRKRAAKGRELSSALAGLKK